MAAKKKRMNSEIARKKIPDVTCMHLWAISAGRCQMCNIPLFKDPTFGESGNYAEKAHIHAVSPNGPRHKTDVGDINDISNLMLLCPEHHKMIDANPENYGDNLLMDIKNDHERRINECVAITDWQETRMVS